MSSVPMIGTIRKLWPSEWATFRDHLLRLDRDGRRQRFAHAVSDGFITDYAKRMCDLGSIVYAYVENGEVRAVAELRKLADAWGEEAEVAFSVEPTMQDHGLGTELMGKVICAARNRGVRRLFMSCLAENHKMQAIARKHEALLRFESGEVIGDIIPEKPDQSSYMSESVDDRVGFMLAVLDINNRMPPAA